MNFLTKFDGSGREPRELQKIALKWLESNWHRPVLAMNLPTGVGKTAIARAIQLHTEKTHVLAPSNILLDQFTESYPGLNYVKGINHYSCTDSKRESCGDRRLRKLKPCAGCPYKECVVTSRTEGTVFNPMSYFYSKEVKEEQDVIVVDEAHKLIPMAASLMDHKFDIIASNVPAEEFTDMTQTADWVSSLAKDLDIYSRLEKDPKKSTNLARKATNLFLLESNLRGSPDDFVQYRDEEHLYIRPIRPSTSFFRKLLNAKKIILMSATILKDDVEQMGFRNFAYLDLDSPIAPERRQVVYRPSKERMNFSTEPEDVANYIKSVLHLHPGLNTIVHVSQSWSERLRDFFPNTVLFNNNESKKETLDKFKKYGGVWIASGCAEGLDLPDDLCRLVIIPMLIMGNIADPVTKKQLELPRGRFRYELNALKTVIQQAGRGVRSDTDFCHIYIGDDKFPNLVLKNKPFLPISFLSAIRWR